MNKFASLITACLLLHASTAFSAIVYYSDIPADMVSAGAVTSEGYYDVPDTWSYWVFAGQAGTEVTLTTIRQEADLDPASGLFAGFIYTTEEAPADIYSGLAYGDDELDPPTDIGGAWGDPQIVFTLPADGFYTFAVTNFLPGLSDGGDGQFSFATTLQGANVLPVFTLLGSHPYTYSHAMIDRLSDAVTQPIFADLTRATGSPQDSGCGFSATNGRLEGGSFSSIGYQLCGRGTLVGASIHQAQTTNNSRQAGQEVEGDARGLSAYFAHAFARNWKVNGIVSYLRTDLDYSNRQLGTVYSADNEVDTLAAKVWVDREWRFANGFSVIPFAGIDYIYNRFGEATEKNNGFLSLDIESFTTESTSLRSGVNVNFPAIWMRAVRVQPYVMAMVDSRLAWNDETLTARYQSLENVAIHADLEEPETTRVSGRAGLKMRMNNIAMDFNLRNNDGFDGNSRQSWALGFSVHLLF